MKTEEALKELNRFQAELKQLMGKVNKNNLLEQVEFDKTADGYFEQNLFMDVFEKLSWVSKTIDYLNKPIRKEGHLHYEGGKFRLDDEVLMSGQQLEIYIYNEMCARDEWARTFVSIGANPYLVGFQGLDTSGLKARVR